MNFEKRNGVEFKPNKKVSLCFQNKFVVFSKKWTVITVGKCAIKLNIFLKNLRISGIFILFNFSIFSVFEEIFIEKLSIFNNPHIIQSITRLNHYDRGTFSFLLDLWYFDKHDHMVTLNTLSFKEWLCWTIVYWIMWRSKCYSLEFSHHLHHFLFYGKIRFIK